MRAAIFLFVVSLIGNALNYFYSITIARILGPNEYSVVLSLLSLLIILAVPINTFQTVVANYVSSFHANKKDNLIKNFLIKAGLKTLVFGALCYVILIVFSGVISGYLKLDSALPVIIIGTTVLPSYSVPVTRGALQGFQSFTALGLNGTIEAALRFLVGVVLIFFGLRVNGALASFPISLFLAFIISIFPLKKFFVSTDSVPVNSEVDFGEVYRYIFPVSVTLLCFAVLTNIDVMMVRHYYGKVLPEVAGYYASAEFIGKIGLYLAGPISIIMFPKTSSLSAKAEDPKSVLIKALAAVACLCGALAISYLTIPDLLVRVFFGPKFINSVPLLPWFGIAMLIFALVNVLLLYQLSIRSFKFVAPLILSVLLEITLIHFFHSNITDVVAMLIINGLLLLLVNYFLVFGTKKSMPLQDLKPLQEIRQELP